MSDEVFLQGHFKYTVEDGKANLCSYCGFEKILTIPKTLGSYSVTRIGWGTFIRCESLVELRIPNSVTRIGGSAFYGCKNLARVKIPDCVIRIGEVAFGKCFGVTEITLSGDNSVYSFLDGALFDKAKRILLTYFGRKYSSPYIIPNFVTNIALKAFMQCTSLKSLVIPDSVTTIENMAFYGCKGLTSVIFGDSVTSIGRGAFCECRRLKKVSLPKSVTSVGEGAFDKGVKVVWE